MSITSIKKIALFLPLIIMVALPLVGFAQPAEAPITDIAGVESLLNRILNIVFVIFFIIAVLFIILAAFGYLTAGGDDEKVKSAKQKLIYAIVAIVVALLATGIDNIIEGILGGQELNR